MNASKLPKQCRDIHICKQVLRVYIFINMYLLLLEAATVNLLKNGYKNWKNLSERTTFGKVAI